MPSIPLC